MTIKTISASYFRTHLSQCVRETYTTGTIFIITYRGKPIARLKPLEPRPSEGEDERQQTESSDE